MPTIILYLILYKNLVKNGFCEIFYERLVLVLFVSNSLHRSLQGNYREAYGQLKCCLAALGRPIPSNRLDLVASLCWNGLRQFLHRIHVDQWLEPKAGSLWHCALHHDVKTSARDAAYVYQKLLQLHLTGE